MSNGELLYLKLFIVTVIGPDAEEKPKKNAITGAVGKDGFVQLKVTRLPDTTGVMGKPTVVPALFT